MHKLLASAGRRAIAAVFFLDGHSLWGRQRKRRRETRRLCAGSGWAPLKFSNKQLLLLHTAALGRQTPAILHGSGGDGMRAPRWHRPPSMIEGGRTRVPESQPNGGGGRRA